MAGSMALPNALSGQAVTAGETLLVLQADYTGTCAAALLHKDATLN
jgi:hypothetical protein